MAKKGDEKPVGGNRERMAPPTAAVAPRKPAPEVGTLARPMQPRPGVRPAPKLDLLEDEGSTEHRQFPRARMAVRFEAWIGDEQRSFAATFGSVNVSVSGAFLESTFFLPMGTELRVRFALENDAAPVDARAQIVREERPDPRTGQGRSGFGIRFVEFFGQTEVTLAKLFLGEQLLSFAAEYMASKRARSLTSELDRVVDALAAWELLKVTTPGDPWRPLE